MIEPLHIANKVVTPNPLLQLMELSRRARLAATTEELAFLIVNDSHSLFPYRQAALWFTNKGVKALSGVIEPEANAPYAQWLNHACRFLQSTYAHASALTAVQLPPDLSGEWTEWLPSYGLWLPFAKHSERGESSGGLLLAADRPWPAEVITLLEEWIDIWHHAWLARIKPSGWSWLRSTNSFTDAHGDETKTSWWKHRRYKLTLIALAAMMIPVRLSILAPGELVPTHPAVIRAPVDGVVGQFQVQPNQAVKAGQALFNFDEASLIAKLDVAMQTLATAQAEYRQYAQQAVSDNKSKAQLSVLLGKIEEKQVEADYLKEQLNRSRVTAPRHGIALFDDPSEWVGKPVQTGERIMRIAAPGDVEVEAWIPIGDIIPLSKNANVNLYLASNPLSSLSAQIRYVAHDATARPDGTYAYRVRARLDEKIDQRVGLKGTAKVSGEWVPLVYWILRRPVSVVRQTLGV